MPGGNRTGPTGMGPMTGRAAGHCAGYAVPGCANPVGGRGMGGHGRGGGGGGGGRGRRNQFYATGLTGRQRAMEPAGGPTEQDELGALKVQADYFQNSLEEIKNRISELESQPAEKPEK